MVHLNTLVQWYHGGSKLITIEEFCQNWEEYVELSTVFSAEFEIMFEKNFTFYLKILTYL